MSFYTCLLIIVIIFSYTFIKTSQGATANASLNQTNVVATDIQAIFNKPIYKNAKWGLRVVDLNTSRVLIDLQSSDKFYIGSIRKIFTIGELLNQVGADYRSNTTVHIDGKVSNGELKGNLVLIASGDLTMGGRTKSNGEIAITDLDHNEANSLGNAQLTETDSLAGYKHLAKQVKAAGINKISGDVIIDDRLFDPFNFRDEFNINPIFVNDDVIDVIINPGKVNEKSLVSWRPQSAAFKVINNLITSKQDTKYTLELNPITPQCIGKPNCYGEIKNQLPINFIPPLTDAYPLIQTFRVTKPANFARTIFIEQLNKAGIDVSALALVKENPIKSLKAGNFYNQSNQIAFLQSLPYGDHAKLILKVSYNIGADTSLLLFGLTKGVRNMADSLRVERDLLQNKYGIPSESFVFTDGSGGGNTMATNTAITKWLEIMANSDSFHAFFTALPILSVDGSLAFVNRFQSNPSLAGAMGKVHAKTGTYVIVENEGLVLKGQSLAGYIETKNHHQLVFQLVVNNVDIHSMNDLLDVFQDQGMIAAILWRDF
ncbi:MAG: D-alanyl-D-alanine carboxypeptidase/D-alanyl-D-alanine-endopeptidase [Gammaproteobacteria bacterium]|nr:D-alanyl-D-alanine carboxypeptidase/D-alanyl-D-alanine-endopeptidase [Gammaproteobacteria bacterium]MCW5583853.1 D-alanyl-D-alanine carboxypeptidase/D-alanyl-D-alanine-endopeptidase [Gammaproteobacteria bacterium]